MEENQRVCANPECKKVFKKPKSLSRKEWEIHAKCCSRSCASKVRGTAHLKAFNFKKGVQNNPDGGFKKGHNPHNFKEKGYGYTAIHKWLSYHYTKTGICKRCGKNTKIDPKKKFRKQPRTQWANISGKYLRDINDYEELCISCHVKSHDFIKHNPNRQAST